MEDKELKELLSTTKLKADDHLKARIVHQIKAEKALIPAGNKISGTAGTPNFSILTIMYVVLLILGLYFYYQTDGKLLESKSFLVSTLFTAGTFSVYWCIGIYLNYKKVKQ